MTMDVTEENEVTTDLLEDILESGKKKESPTKALESNNVKPDRNSPTCDVPMNVNEDDDSSDPPRTVTEDRKTDLLREARDNRSTWIQFVPTPYSRVDGALGIFHVVKELPTATKILTYLYGNKPLSAARLAELLPNKDCSAMRSGNEILEDELAESSSDEIRTILQDYQKFSWQLQRPESAALANGLRHSLRNLDESNLAMALRTLITSTLEQFQRQQDPHIWTKRSLESFLYGQAYETISASLRKEQIQDHECYKKLQQLSFVTPKHLDLTCFGDTQTVNTQLNKAVSLLISMQSFFSPYEKLQLIFKCYHNVNEAITLSQNGKPPSADDVLPALIMTVLLGQPKHLVSNLRMIEVHAAPEYLRGEAGYAYTSLYGAVQFLLELDLKDENPSSLTISSQEFREGLEASRKEMEQQINERVNVKEPENVTPQRSISVLVSKVRTARLNGEDVDIEWARQNFGQNTSTNAAKDLPKSEREQDPLPSGFTRNYSFLGARPEDIRMSELPRLLEEYRMLVRTTETLLAERAQKASAERKARLEQAEKVIEENALKLELGFASTS